MLVFLVLLLPILIILIRHLLFGAAKLPPGPTIWQLWQKRSTFATNPHVALKELSQIYGPLFSIRLGAQLAVIASSPAMAEKIHKTNNLIFCGRHMPSVYFNVPGVANACLAMATDCDASWKFLRGVAQNFIFSPKAIQSAAVVREKKVVEMMRFLMQAAAGKAVVVNIERALYTTFSNIITTVLVSRDLFEVGGVGERDERVMEFIDEIVNKATVLGVADVFPILRGVEFWSRGKSMEIYHDIKLIWGDIIKQRRATMNDDAINPNSEKDFLDVLNGYSFDDDQLAIILMELLIASTDSTTITVVWLLAELIKNQEILDKARKEIENLAVDEGGNLNESRLSECSYLEACIKETLRVHIPGPFAVPHRATKTCKINNYTIPKDSIVLVNAWAIHLDPSIWEDAASFKPERFLSSEINFQGAHFEFLPFSAGNRMCPGRNVAIKGVQLVVASLVHYFDWSLPNGLNPSELDMTDKFGTSLKMEKPFHLIPKLREHVCC